MKIQLLLALLIISSASLSSQSISETVEQITGHWVGTLTYTDYQDDTTQTTLACKMSASWKKNKGKISIGFEEPNGKIYYDKTIIKILSGDSRALFDGSQYDIESFDIGDQTDHWTLVLNRNGKDNRKSALIRQSIVYEGDRISLIKEVQYQNTATSFVRNSYLFRRE